MNLKNAIASRIREIIKDRKLNQYKVSKLTGIPQSTLSTILNGDIKAIKISTLYDFCAGIGIEISEFFDSELFKLKNLED